MKTLSQSLSSCVSFRNCSSLPPKRSQASRIVFRQASSASQTSPT